MSFSGQTNGANLYTQGFGSRPENVEIPVLSKVAPSAINYNYPLGKRWINTVSNTEYVLTSISTAGNVSNAVWTLLGTNGGALNTLSDTSSTTASPSGGNIQIAGTSNQITSTAGASAITLSLPSTVVAPGSLSAASGNITATNGNLVLGTAGNKIVSTSVGTTTAAGANSFGSVVLVAGTATVASTAVTANSLIFLTSQALGTVTAPSALCVSAKTASTSFVITASQATDTSTIAWFIVN